MRRALAAALVLLGPAAAGAAGLEASLDVASRYSWRGIMLNPGFSCFTYLRSLICDAAFIINSAEP